MGIILIAIGFILWTVLCIMIARLIFSKRETPKFNPDEYGLREGQAKK